MSEIGNQILSRFGEVDKRPKEAFPWQPSKTFPDLIIDANGEKVAASWGYGGDRSILSVGTAERRRLILEAPAMLEFLRELASELSGYRDWKGDRAAEILDRIEGRDP